MTPLPPLVSPHTPLLTSAQLPGRSQFKHVIFAPQAWSGYNASYFPAIRDALDEQDWSLAQKQLEKAVAILNKATDKLLH